MNYQKDLLNEILIQLTLVKETLENNAEYLKLTNDLNLIYISITEMLDNKSIKTKAIKKLYNYYHLREIKVRKLDSIIQIKILIYYFNALLTQTLNYNLTDEHPELLSLIFYSIDFLEELI